ncbi:MAG: GC-type dockerin domain-anchored protein [Phycisphaerales bacterium]
MDDRFLFIGNPGEPTLCPDPFDCGTGALHVFELDGDGLWQRTQHIVPPDITVGSGFGGSFSRDGDRLLVGAGGAVVNGEPAGKSYLYEHDGEQWREVFQFRPSEPTLRQGFGGVVALENDTAILRQYRPLQQLLIYEKSTDGWHLAQTIPSPLPRSAEFGLDFLLSGEWLFVGAPADETEMFLGGSLFVYRRSAEDEFEFDQRIVPPDVSEPIDSGPLFGGGILYNGHTLAIGGGLADRSFVDQGVVYLYEHDGTEWILSQEITHEPAGQGHRFSPLDMSGGLLTAATVDETSGSVNGASYIFSRDPDGTWSQAARIDAAGRTGGFGIDTVTNGSHVAIGAGDAVFGGFSVGLVHAYDLGCLICEADLDLDGSLTIFDFLVFANLFQDGRSEADFDGDGELTIFDFLAFQNAFQAGCP